MFNSTIWNISIGLITAFIGFVLALAWKKFLKWFTYRKIKSFWRPLYSNDLQVVIGKFEKFGDFEPTGLIGLGDAIALAELGKYFEKFEFSGFKIVFSDHLKGDNLKTNLILLGGPDANPITKAALKFIPSTITEDASGIAIYDSLQEKLYIPSKKDESSKEVSKDYGVIIKTENPFDKKKDILIIYGAYGFGTWAGVRFAVTEAFTNHEIISTCKSFECLIETEVVLDTPQQTRSITVRKLS